MKTVQFFFAAAMASALFAAAPSLASEYGTAAEADALLKRAIAEVQIDPDAALAKFNDPNGGFRDRDLYVFCADAATGTLVAHPAILGTDLGTLADKTGKPFGREMVDDAREGAIIEVSYMWPRPDNTEPVEKVSYVTRIGGHVCGVGYYK